MFFLPIDILCLFRVLCVCMFGPTHPNFTTLFFCWSSIYIPFNVNWIVHHVFLHLNEKIEKKNHSLPGFHSLSLFVLFIQPILRLLAIFQMSNCEMMVRSSDNSTSIFIIDTSIITEIASKKVLFTVHWQYFWMHVIFGYMLQLVDWIFKKFATIFFFLFCLFNVFTIRKVEIWSIHTFFSLHDYRCSSIWERHLFQIIFPVKLSIPSLKSYNLLFLMAPSNLHFTFASQSNKILPNVLLLLSLKRFIQLSASILTS